MIPEFRSANSPVFFLSDSGLTWWSVSTWMDDRHVLFPVLFCCFVFSLSTVLYSFLALYIDSISEKYLSPKLNYFYCFEVQNGTSLLLLLKL
jgi:hypothetical protein